MWILLLPAAELLLFRHWSKIQNTPPISQLPLLAILLAFALFFQILLEKKGQPRLKPRGDAIALHGVLWIFLLWGGVAWERWVRLLGDSGARLAWYFLAFLAVGTSLLAWVDRREAVRRLQGARREAVFLLLASSAFALYESFHQHLWAGFSGATIPPVQFLLGCIGVPVQISLRDFSIIHPRFHLKIMAPCSGLEGMALLIFALSLMGMMRPGNWILGRRGIKLYAAGLGYLFLLNTIRISLLFGLGVWVSERWGEAAALKVVLRGFHAHVGWILYLAGIALYLFFIMPKNPDHFFRK